MSSRNDARDAVSGFFGYATGAGLLAWLFGGVGIVPLLTVLAGWQITHKAVSSWK